uniref:B30.2/SPRY domain-containing protein n=1 Tax=Cyprinodon variegatus TaxID=28743 RepID=A0A3Q2CAN4_CYPVA
MQKPETLGGFPIIPKSKIDKADRTDMVDQMLQTYCESTLQVTKKILKKLDRNDLVQGLVEEIYIEMNLAVKENKEFSSEQGIRYIESASRKLTKVEKTVGYDSIFRDRLGENKTARTVLTIGVAGIGKTALTQKFTLNWAEEKTNNEFHFIFPFSFKALSAMKKSLSLVELIHHFFAETKEAEISKFGEFKVIFILDGLDESRLQLDFRLSKKVSDIKEKASVDVLVTNIIKGNLLPNAHIWITSRPAAASQIPAECIDLVTEVTGFNQAQKLLYFRKKCGDQNIHSKIMPYVSASQSLNTLCQMPICCWITATVLEDLLKHKEKEELPKTVTELYINFLQVQFRQKAVTEAEIQWNQSSKDKILTLGKLAFEQLQKGNLVFYDSELKGSGITTKSVSVYTGIFPEIFKDEDVSDQAKVCCFTHLSVQEFLAALYVHLTFTNTQVNVLDEAQSSWMGVLGRRKSNPHHTAVDKALQSPNGELDMFLRFLMGLLLPSSQSLLKGLVKKPENDTKAIEDAIKYIKEKLDNDLSTEHSINLLHCLNELNDNSLVEEIQRFMASGRLTVDCLSNKEAFMRLIPVTHLHIFFISYFKHNQGSRTDCLSLYLFSLSACELSERGISALNGILSSQNSILKELDLSYNNLGDGGIRQLAEGLESPNCSLEVLRLSGCSLTWKACDTLASVISSQSRLKVLDISNNDLHNEGLESLCAGLENQLCKLECLRSASKVVLSGLRLSLSGCQITEEGCHSLVTALQANPSHLRELDLSYNHPGKEGVQLLSGGLSDDNKKVTVVMEEQPYPDHPERFDHCCWQLLCKNGLTGRSYWEVKREGPVIMAVSYKRLSRKGPTADCRLGWNDQCWSLVCSDRQYSFWHNRKETVYTPQYASLLSLRVGVYVDVPAGIISFYAVSANEMFHLHTFKTSFTAPLYPAFGFGFGCWSYNSSVSLCQV